MTSLVPEMRDTQITLESYVRRAVENTDSDHPETSIIDPVTAARLAVKAIHSTRCVLSDETLQDLHEIAGDNDQERIPNRILAPALRVIEDFRDEDYVVLQQGIKGRYLTHKLFALDEFVDRLAVVDPTIESKSHWINQIDPKSWLVAGTSTHMLTLVEPAYSGLFPLTDYALLENRKQVYQTDQNFYKATKFALGLSCFCVPVNTTGDAGAALDENRQRYNAQLRRFEIFHKVKD